MLARGGQRRILSIDGGGIRGLLALGALEQVELRLRQASGRPSLRLCDYFDLIAGTSTGGIIAAGLAIGLSVADIRQFYVDNARAIFRPVGWLSRLRSKYTSRGLTEKLNEVFRGLTLGSPELETLLLIVMRNVHTDSPWLISNNPRAMFNDRALPDCNLDIPLSKLIRASTAAPFYFEAEEIQVGNRTFAFMDGGTTPYNNPSFQAFLQATVDRYNLNWATGADRLLLVSVGTGTRAYTAADRPAKRIDQLFAARTVPPSLIGACTREQDLLCRVFGDCLHGMPIDLEVGDLIASRGPTAPKLFTYLRYDVSLTREAFDQIGLNHIDPLSLKLDSINAMTELMEAGAMLGKQVADQHFAGFPAP